MQIAHQEVKSSTIKSIGYDYPTGTMEVHFHTTGLYIFHDFPHTEYQKLMDAQSIGTHFNLYIKGKFPAKKGGVDK